MKKITIVKLFKRILHQDINDIDIAYFPFEESKGHYKNIYKIISKDKVYVLKKAKEHELDIYSSLNNSSKHIPFYYGSYHYYKNDYILFEYIEGHNVMKMDKDNLYQIIDSIIDIQKKYWLSNKSFGLTIEKQYESRYKRLSYLPDELKEVYEMYLSSLKETPITFSHEDLLPFNVIVNDKQVVFIDLEVGGILAYPTMLARLITHTSLKEDALFYLSESDYHSAIEYYYDNFIKEQGISKDAYLKTMNLFIYNELIEWIYVYKKYGYAPNGFYNNYYQKALNKRDEILKQ